MKKNIVKKFKVYCAKVHDKRKFVYFGVNNIARRHQFCLLTFLKIEYWNVQPLYKWISHVNKYLYQRASIDVNERFTTAKFYTLKEIDALRNENYNKKKFRKPFTASITDAIQILSPIQTVSPCKANIIYKNQKNICNKLMQSLCWLMVRIHVQYTIFKIGS